MVNGGATVHIDYLTATCNDPVEYERCKRALRGIEPDEPIKKQEFYGFRGLRWEKPDYGSRFVGTRELDGYAMISCSGQAAHTEALRLRFLSCWQPSRIDIAVDVGKHFDVPAAYAQWQGATRTKLTAIEAETLYIGSRKSDIFWRVYNKAIELGKPEMSPLWRIELELKGERAKQFWRLWQAHRADLSGLLWAYLWLPNGKPREPVHSLLSSYLEAKGDWHIGPLPRRQPAGEGYLWNNVIPFLRDNWEWAGPIVQEELMRRE
jgi:hypothetical protein